MKECRLSESSIHVTTFADGVKNCPLLLNSCDCFESIQAEIGS
jgi:hypothetical protein